MTRSRLPHHVPITKHLHCKQDARAQSDAYGAYPDVEDTCACGSIIASKVLDTEPHHCDCPRGLAEYWGLEVKIEFGLHPEGQHLVSGLLAAPDTWLPWATVCARLAGHFGRLALAGVAHV